MKLLLRVTLREILLLTAVIALSVPYVLSFLNSSTYSPKLFSSLDSTKMVFDWAKAGDSTCNPLDHSVVYFHRATDPFFDYATAYRFEMDCIDCDAINNAVFSGLKKYASDSGFSIVSREDYGTQGCMTITKDRKDCWIYWTTYKPSKNDNIPRNREMNAIEIIQYRLP